MATLLYPHLTVEVDTDHFFEDLNRQYSYSNSSYAERLRIRDEIKNRRDSMQSWLTDHGYRCGNDYFETETGYRFVDNSLAVAFVLVWAR